MKEFQFLYLVSCEKGGEGFWKIGITDNINPLKESRDFIECYRKELIGLIAAKKILNAIQTTIESLLNDCMQDGYIIHKPSEGISYDLPLSIVEEIYDFWFNLYKDNDTFVKVLGLLSTRKKLNFSHPSISKGLKGFTAKWVSNIEKLHEYRPPSTKPSLSKEPMWIDGEG